MSGDTCRRGRSTDSTGRVFQGEREVTARSPGPRTGCGLSLTVVQRGTETHGQMQLKGIALIEKRKGNASRTFDK